MSSTIAEASMILTDILSPVFVEVCMFALAVFCYVAFLGLPSSVSGKRVASLKKIAGVRCAKTVKNGSDFETRSPSLTKPVAEPKAELSTPAAKPRTDLIHQARAISAFGKEGNLAKAFSVFSGLRTSGSQPNTLVYNCLLDACVQCDDLASALKYLGEMKVAGMSDVVSFNTVMKGHLLKGGTDAALKLLEEMLATGVVPSPVTFHALLNAMAKGGDRCRLWQVVKLMEESGIQPTATTCAILLKTVTSVSNTQDLNRILALADRCDKPEEEILFACTVESCIRSKNLSLLSERVNIFAKTGDLSKLTCATYGTMIKAFGQAGHVDTVWALWRQMVEQQIVPTAITFGCMVEALVVNRQASAAWDLVNDIWEDESWRPSVNTVTYSTLLKGFSMSKEHEKVTAVFDEMRARNIQRNVITYNTIINSIAMCGLMDRMSDVLDDMQAAEPKVSPDLVTYSTIIKGYCQSGMFEKALSLFRQMQRDARIVPDEVMYNSLLDGCAREHRVQDALRLLDEMRCAQVPPSSYTLSIACKLLSRARRLEQAFSLVESVSKEYGFTPSIHVYTCLIQACFNNRQLSKAFALHDDIIQQDVSPDEKVYSSMVRGCLQAGQPEKAAVVVRCAYHLPSPGGLLLAKGSAQGVDPKCLREVFSALKQSNPEAAARLEQDVQRTARRR